MRSRDRRFENPWLEAPPWAWQLKQMMGLILQKMEIVMAKVEDLEAEVAEESTVIGSVETLVGNLIEQIKSAGTDPAKLDAVLSSLQANKARLGALVAANTPANAEAVASPAAPEIS